MRIKDYFTVRIALTALATSFAVWGFISISFSALGRLPRYQAASTVWQQQVGLGSVADATPLVVIVVAVLTILGVQIALRDTPREMRSFMASFIVLLATISSSPSVSNLPATPPLAEFVLVRTAILFFAMGMASVVCYYLVDRVATPRSSPPPIPIAAS